MAKFDDFLAEVRTGITQLANLEARLRQTSHGDGQQFVDALEPDLRLWTRSSSGATVETRLRVSRQGKEQRDQMKALTQAGVTAIRIDQIRAALIKLIVIAAARWPESPGHLRVRAQGVPAPTLKADCGPGAGAGTGFYTPHPSR